ncbi:hypothetical protein BpHYR1_024931 [Brachionus plicatilis]|uniref:Uncharacterized protein n=1 Tax=Brachionus plicatilis TaxID=10195 RepID=A0A3M7SHY0_BRAPC|nr:hypothetical protein BpHYR1_024931 [Brachionus plicatilis]
MQQIVKNAKFKLFFYSISFEQFNQKNFIIAFISISFFIFDKLKNSNKNKNKLVKLIENRQ